MPINENSEGVLTRKEIVARLSDRLSLSAREGTKILDDFLNCIIENLAQGNSVSLTMLGRFSVAPRVARPGRNPRTGQVANVKAGQRAIFTLSRNLRAEIKGAFTSQENKAE